MIVVRRSVPAGAALFLALTGVVGCSAGHDAAAELPDLTTYFDSVEAAAAYAEEQGLDLMAQILEDGTVTRGEVEEATREYIACRERAGVTITGTPQWDPLDRLNMLGFSADGDSYTSDEARLADARCETAHHYVSHWFETNTKPESDANFLRELEHCLAEESLPFVAGQQHYRDTLGPELNARGDVPQIWDCINAVAERLDTRYVVRA